MSEMQDRIDELAELMCEFKLSEAEVKSDDFTIRFKKRSKAMATAAADTGPASEFLQEDDSESDLVPSSANNKPAGIPITSPMTGIYYASPSPSSPSFVHVGEVVTAGQVIGLIEAMKVFNEVPAPTSGTVSRIMVESGQLVNLGDPLMYVD